MSQASGRDDDGQDPASVPAPALDQVVAPSLAGRVAIVTGAGQGIGRVFAKAFALSGAIPVIAERNGATALSVADGGAAHP